MRVGRRLILNMEVLADAKVVTEIYDIEGMQSGRRVGVKSLNSKNESDSVFFTCQRPSDHEPADRESDVKAEGSAVGERWRGRLAALCLQSSYPYYTSAYTHEYFTMFCAQD